MDALDLTADVVGGRLQLPGTATAEIMGTVGFDAVAQACNHVIFGL
jgi:4-hydroxy-2-oxoheptanedioate aldolase